MLVYDNIHYPEKLDEIDQSGRVGQLMSTIREIARRAGVSIGTVDRVLHSRGHVTPETAAKIRQAIRELNYTPNIFARQLKLARPFVFGVLMPRLEQDHEYWQLPARGIEKAWQELKPHQVQIQFFHYNRYSPMSFSRACEQVLQARLDGLLMAPALAAIAAEFIRRLPAGLPCVFFDSMVPGASCLSSIVQDSRLSGRLAGRLMHLLLAGRGEVAAIRIQPEDFHISERINGFHEFLLTQDGCPVTIYDVVSPEEPSSLVDLTRAILAEKSGLSGIFVSNALTFKVAEVLAASPVDRAVKLIGYDLIEPNIACLKQGSIDFLISQQSERQGYQGIYSLFRRVVLGEEVPARIMMSIDIITRENVDHYPRRG